MYNKQRFEGGVYVMAILQVELLAEEVERLNARARESGYEAADEYVRAVIERLLDEADDESTEKILADLKAAWIELRRGGGLTLEEFRKALDDDA
jgi:glutamyl-tRNA reductase